MLAKRNVWIFALATLPACECNGIPIGADGGSDVKAGSSIACYIATQFRCTDYPNATAAQLSTDVPTMCSSVSGVLSQPAACPTASFGGKCTRPASEGYIERFYTGADLAYARDFCVNTALGTWSTTF